MKGLERRLPDSFRHVNRLPGAGFDYDVGDNMASFGTGSGTARYDVDPRMVWVSTKNSIGA